MRVRICMVCVHMCVCVCVHVHVCVCVCVFVCVERVERASMHLKILAHSFFIQFVFFSVLSSIHVFSNIT